VARAIGSAHQIPARLISSIVPVLDVIYKLQGAAAATASRKMYRVMSPVWTTSFERRLRTGCAAARDMAVGTDHQLHLDEVEALLSAALRSSGAIMITRCVRRCGSP